MVVAIGGLAIGSAVQAAASRREALARVAGAGAMARTPVEFGYFVTEDGTRTPNTRGERDGARHVHVKVAPDKDPNAVMVQLTDRTRMSDALSPRGHHDLILFLRKPSEARLRAAEDSLVAILRRTSRGKQ
jgi:hypothetical protein